MRGAGVDDAEALDAAARTAATAAHSAGYGSSEQGLGCLKSAVL